MNYIQAFLKIFILTTLVVGLANLPPYTSRADFNHLYMQYTMSGVLPPGAVGWSAYGVAPGNADNTTALNNLPGNQNIYCDTVGTIRVQTQWFWKSNLNITGLGTGNCPIRTAMSCTADSCGWISQSNLNAPITNVFIDGLDFAGAANTQTGLAYYLWVDNLTFVHSNTGLNNGWGFFRGANQEFGWCTVANGPLVSGRPGFRHFGNSADAVTLAPEVPTSPTGYNGVTKPLIYGQPPSVWIHDCNAQSGDGVYQISQGDTGRWPNINALYYLYENSVATGSDGPLVLISYSTRQTPPVNDYTSTTQYVVMRNISGTGNHTGLTVLSNNASSGGIFDVQLNNITIDSSADTNAPATAEIRAFNGGVVQRVSVDSLKITNPLASALLIDGTQQDISITNGSLGTPRTGTTPNVILRNGLRYTLTGNTIPTFASYAIQTGATSAYQTSYPNISSNTITGIPNGYAGIFWGNVDHATGNGNTFTPASGSTTSQAFTLSLAGSIGPGTTNSTMTGNTVTGIPGTPPIVCAPGQSNSVTGNTGATDCPP